MGSCGLATCPLPLLHTFLISVCSLLPHLSRLRISHDGVSEQPRCADLECLMGRHFVALYHFGSRMMLPE